jgi:hypothetical protein
VFEVNAVYFILLAEGFGILLLVLLVWMAITVVKIRRKKKAVGELLARFNARSVQRGEQTESFLRVIFNLEGEDLRAALENIDKHETHFFQQLINGLYRGKVSQIGALDAELDKLIESYKCLLPRVEESASEVTDATREVTVLRGENERLRSELVLVKNKMSGMISEFGNMFGGGKDHKLDLHQVKEKVAAIQAENEIDIKLEP